MNDIGQGSSTIIQPIVEQHAEETAFLWLQRDAAVRAPNYSLDDLTNLDDRIEAHIDGLRIVQEMKDGKPARRSLRGKKQANFLHQPSWPLKKEMKNGFKLLSKPEKNPMNFHAGLYQPLAGSLTSNQRPIFKNF